LISVETQGRVAVVQMAHGKANALDTALCQDLVAQLGELERGGYRAAVLTGRGAIFSAGVDLMRLCDGGPDYLNEFLPALSKAFLAVFSCSVPVVAAVNGHAIAGGCILACACDHRVMNASHGRIGVTELLVGVPFLVTALGILRFPVGTHRLKELTYFGRTYPATDAMGLGLIDEAVAEKSVLERAVAILLSSPRCLPNRCGTPAGRSGVPRWAGSPKSARLMNWCTGCGTRPRFAKRSRST
jgi:enoyl-CoA hydratase